MGNADWINSHFRPATKALGKVPTIKISHSSDRYDPAGNFAGLIMYHWNGSFKWYNAHKGFNGQTLYVALLDTRNWPDDKFRRAGEGKVHDYIFESTFGECMRRNAIGNVTNLASVGGFAVMKNTVKLSSLWFNTTSKADPLLGWQADGSKHLSESEALVVFCAIKAWVDNGTHQVVDIHPEIVEYFNAGPNFVQPLLVRNLRATYNSLCKHEGMHLTRLLECWAPAKSTCPEADPEVWVLQVASEQTDIPVQARHEVFSVSYVRMSHDKMKMSFAKEGIRLTWQEAIACLHAEGSKFRTTLSGVMKELPFDAFFWLCSPVSRAFAPVALFEFVVIEAPCLEGTVADFERFKEHLECFTGKPVARAFPNLGRDAILVAPAPCSCAPNVYAHVANFFKGAPDEQMNALWRELGTQLQQRLRDASPQDHFWVNTIGTEVPWLHVRIDSKPKYYGSMYEAYKNPEASSKLGRFDTYTSPPNPPRHELFSKRAGGRWVPAELGPPAISSKDHVTFYFEVNGLICRKTLCRTSSKIRQFGAQLADGSNDRL